MAAGKAEKGPGILISLTAIILAVMRQVTNRTATITNLCDTFNFQIHRLRLNTHSIPPVIATMTKTIATKVGQLGPSGEKGQMFMPNIPAISAKGSMIVDMMVSTRITWLVRKE